uniref:OAR domain-containing protein n=1 Tax=Anopheles albimanus TaxID=7167 RepID=A0A182FK29_ANOAL
MAKVSLTECQEVVWFKNRRAKWRKRERNQMNAIAAADFKNGFGPQFVQPFADTDSLYSSYSYNNWAKVPSPLGAKTFPWTVNPLGTSIVSSNHHQSSINCFNTSSASAAVAAGMAAGTGSMLPAGMGTAGLGAGTTGATGVSPTPCPYTTPTNPYMYHHRAAAAAAAEPCTAMSSSIATLRLKAKQHTSGFTSPYSAPSPQQLQQQHQQQQQQQHQQQHHHHQHQHQHQQSAYHAYHPATANLGAGHPLELVLQGSSVMAAYHQHYHQQQQQQQQQEYQHHLPISLVRISYFSYSFVGYRLCWLDDLVHSFLNL